MIANYGFMDGTGEFYIAIDTDQCIECEGHACVDACPRKMLEIIVDDYDDEVAALAEPFRKTLRYDCNDCKPVGDRPPLPCVAACPNGALQHSW